MLTKQVTRALCALFMLGALVAFTGCGGDDDKSSSSPSSSSGDTTATPAPATDTTDTGGSPGGGSLAAYKAGTLKAAQEFQKSATKASTKASAPGKDKLQGLEALKASVT